MCVEAVALLGLTLAAAFWGSLAVDRLLEPPAWVRAAMVLASVAGLENGALTESLIVNLVVERDGKIVRLDQWEKDDLDLALARFDELTATD